MIRWSDMARRPHAPAALLAGILALGGCEEKDPVVLRLEGECVRRSDFERQLMAVEARGLGPLTPETRRGLLDAFLEQRALAIEARRRGLLAPGAAAEDEPAAVLQLLAVVAPPPAVTDAEIEACYRTQPAERTVPETVALRQILLGTLNEARDVRRRLARDPRAFDTIARTQSKGPEAEIGGYMGRFERGQLPPELEAVAFALPTGGISQPVETALGYHVLRVESRQSARELSLEEARERIRGRLAREKQDEAVRAFVAGLLARAKVNHEAALRPSRPS
jgi:parvulin-like peptidyl-prolyl isomerase